MENLITQKLEELIELTDAKNDVNSKIVLLILHGAISSGQDGMLAEHLQYYAKNVLLPDLEIRKKSNLN